MATKLIKLNTNGSIQDYSGVVQSTGASQAGEFPALDSSGKLDSSVLPNATGADAVTLVAGEALSAGDFVYIDSTGKAMKADATVPAKAAMGYVLVAVASAGNATVYFDDSNSALTGLTAGSTYFLDVVAGKATLTPTTTAGQIVQQLGIATSSTNLHVGIKQPITRS